MPNTINTAIFGGGDKLPNELCTGWGNGRDYDGDASSNSESPIFELPKGWEMVSLGGGLVRTEYGSTGSFTYTVYGSNDKSSWTALKSWGNKDGFYYRNSSYKYYKMTYSRSSYCQCAGAIWFEKLQ